MKAVVDPVEVTKKAEANRWAEWRQNNRIYDIEKGIEKIKDLLFAVQHNITVALEDNKLDTDLKALNETVTTKVDKEEVGAIDITTVAEVNDDPVAQTEQDIRIMTNENNIRQLEQRVRNLQDTATELSPALSQIYSYDGGKREASSSSSSSDVIDATSGGTGLVQNTTLTNQETRIYNLFSYLKAIDSRLNKAFAASPDLATTHMLLHLGANPNTFINGAHPIKVAVDNGDKQLLATLGEFHATMPKRASEAEETVLMQAAREGKIEIVRILLKSKVNPNELQRPTLSWRAWGYETFVAPVTHIRSGGYQPNGHTALHSAAGNKAIIDLLLAHEANGKILDLNGQTYDQVQLSQHVAIPIPQDNRDEQQKGVGTQWQRRVVQSAVSSAGRGAGDL